MKAMKDGRLIGGAVVILLIVSLVLYGFPDDSSRLAPDQEANTYKPFAFVSELWTEGIFVTPVPLTDSPFRPAL